MPRKKICSANGLVVAENELWEIGFVDLVLLDREVPDLRIQLWDRLRRSSTSRSRSTRSTKEIGVVTWLTHISQHLPIGMELRVELKRPFGPQQSGLNIRSVKKQHEYVYEMPWASRTSKNHAKRPEHQAWTSNPWYLDFQSSIHTSSDMNTIQISYHRNTVIHCAVAVLSNHASRSQPLRPRLRCHVSTQHDKCETRNSSLFLIYTGLRSQGIQGGSLKFSSNDVIFVSLAVLFQREILQICRMPPYLGSL